MDPREPSKELEGLSAVLEGLRYQFGGPNVPPEKPHVFIYFIKISNKSDRTVQLLGRKWIVRENQGELLVIEGDKIVGEEPLLEPGEAFSYNSFHLSDCEAEAECSFHGRDADGRKIHCRLPSFWMRLPS